MGAVFTAPIEYVYFIKAGPHVKIGRATCGIGTRMAQLQTGNAYEMQCKFYIKLYLRDHSSFVGEKIERFVHNLCKGSHFRGEWFHYHDAMRSVYSNIERICNYLEGCKDIRYYKFGFGEDAQSSSRYAFRWGDNGTEILNGLMLGKMTDKRLNFATRIS